MSAYSTRELTREEAIDKIAEYKRHEFIKNTSRYTEEMLEIILNNFAEDYPELYLLTNWRVKDGTI